MSKVWSLEDAGLAACVGSFAIDRGTPSFTPWGSDTDAAEEPFEAPDVEAIRADAYAEGWEEGRRTAELEHAAERDALTQLAASLAALQPEPTNALALLLAETVDRLVRQIAGNVAVDPDLLMARAEAAAAIVGDETGPFRLRLNPEDLPLLDAARLPVELVADAHLERGSLKLDTGQGWIEDGPAVRLDRLRAELNRMGAAG